METNESSKKPKRPSNITKYSGIGVQMIASMLLGAWGGNALDKYFNFRFPAFTLGLILFALVGSMYIFIRQVMKDSQ